MKTNLESRYLFLKRFIAYYPSTVFLRNSILKISKEHELSTIRGLVYTTNRVFLFLIVSSYTISIIESIYFFATESNQNLKIRHSVLVYLLGLEFNWILFLKFIFKTFLKIIQKISILLNRLFFKFLITIRYISIRSIFSFLKIFLLRVSKNAINIFFLPITASTFILDKFLEPVEIRWFYQPLPITKESPFFFT